MNCIRCKNEGEALEEAPFSNAIGERIYKEICKTCFRLWVRDSINIINEHLLDLNNAEHIEKYDAFMEEYFFGDNKS